MMTDKVPSAESDSDQGTSRANSAALAPTVSDTDPTVPNAKGLFETTKPRPPMPRHVRYAALTALAFLIILVGTIIIYALT